MSFLKSSINITDYCLDTKGTSINPTQLFEKLSALAFIEEPIDVSVNNVGIVNFFNMADGRLDNIEMFYSSPYFFFGVRNDIRKVDSKLAKMELDKRIEKFLKEQPQFNRIPKAMKEELRDQINLDLLRKAVPSPTFFQCIINLETNKVLVSSKSTKQLETAQNLFRQLFEDQGYLLKRTPPIKKFIQSAGGAETEKGEMLATLNEAATDSVLEQVEANKALWQDFLAWMLFTSYGGGDCTKFSDPESGGSMTAFLDKKLVAVGACSEGVQKVVISGPQSHVKEIKAALQSDKHIDLAGITIETPDDDKYSFNLEASWLSMSSIKMPVARVDPDPDANQFAEDLGTLLVRIHQIGSVQQRLDAIINQFLDVRTDTEMWQSYKKSYSDWLTE